VELHNAAPRPAHAESRRRTDSKNTEEQGQALIVDRSRIGTALLNPVLRRQCRDEAADLDSLFRSIHIFAGDFP
jgi:hypothetical protein